MFTGIIARTGKIRQIRKNQIAIEVHSLPKNLKPGQSIAVDGACLTVAKKRGQEIIADVMPETLKKTTLGRRKTNDLLNLELPLPVTGCFEGHLVTGHVEAVGKITRIERQGNSRLVTIQIPTALIRYVIPKGSIALNGVSLTVIKIQKNLVTVGLILHTWRHTNFQTLKIGDKVNIETDLLAKYFEKWQK